MNAREFSFSKHSKPDHPRTRLYQLRCERGLTLRDVGEAIGVAFSYINVLESGDVDGLNVTYALRLAAFYETSVEDLFGGQHDD